MAQYQLVLRVGPSPGKVFPIMKNELTIGRDINNEITINDSEISRRHCRLVMAEDSYIIEDLGSTNGTWINDQRLAGSHQLVSGESFRLGDNVVLEFGLVGFDEDATVASAGAAKPAAPPAAPAAPPAAAPPAKPAAPPPQKQQYAGQVAASPPPEKKKGMNKGLIIGCSGLIVVAICVTIALFYIDRNYLWCEVSWGLIPGC
ncbi:MAG: FHA domain-containing protein [Chloroflexota bacterium]